MNISLKRKRNKDKLHSKKKFFSSYLLVFREMSRSKPQLVVEHVGSDDLSESESHVLLTNERDELVVNTSSMLKRGKIR